MEAAVGCAAGLPDPAAGGRQAAGGTVKLTLSPDAEPVARERHAVPAAVCVGSAACAPRPGGAGQDGEAAVCRAAGLRLPGWWRLLTAEVKPEGGAAGPRLRGEVRPDLPALRGRPKPRPGAGCGQRG